MGQNIVISRSFALPSPTTIEEVEQRLCVSFPSDYREFLLTANGGVPERYLHFYVADHGDVMLGAIFGIGPDRTSLDVQYEQEQATIWEPLPRGYIAIANDPGGNLVLLSTIGQDAGRVWFWDRVGFWVGEDGQNLFPVAPNFTQFIESLQAK